LEPRTPCKYSTVSGQRECLPAWRPQPPAKHERTCKSLIYIRFSLHNFSSICCKHGAKPLCGALDAGCPQSYPQFLWVSAAMGSACDNVTVCDAVAAAS
jgi:hypothetical protein